MTINVMVNGFGNMATEVSKQILKDKDFELSPYAFTGEGMPEKGEIEGRGILLVNPNEKSGFLACLREDISPFVSVDFTHPDAVNSNADFYCRNNLPFVMGTTGGDRAALEQRVKDSDIVAVIAPNMAKQIVVFQSMMQYAAQTFPNAFRDYTLDIVESHQKGKADTSGTAKAMVEKLDGSPGYFNQLGIPFRKDQIRMIREPEEQLRLGVPEDALTGHGWHTYTLHSEDGTVLFQFTHNVNGRDVYAKGTLDAIRYLQKKIDAGEKGKVYSMIDVLKGE